MNAFIHHFLYDFRTGLRDKSLLLMNYLFPLGFYVLMGLLMTGLNPTFAPTMIPAMILVAMMACTLLGLPNPIVEARESGIYRSFKINGVPALSIVSIPVISSLVHIILVSAIITVTAVPLFKAGMVVNWGYFVLVLLLTAFTMASLGMLIGVVSPNSRLIVLFSQAIFLPSMILGGLMIPSSMLPPGLYRVSLLLPTTYAMNAWRGLSLGLDPTFDPRWALLI
ncbi:MAG TPA: ABC transporter permease, partial [Anaerolineales bacterium]|nr:ABC transporter permease [Anaerolineales bacterium]